MNSRVLLGLGWLTCVSACSSDPCPSGLVVERAEGARTYCAAGLLEAPTLPRLCGELTVGGAC